VRARRFLIVVLLVFVACSRSENEAAETASEGASFSSIRAAPDFALETLSGDTLTLADLDSTKAILLNFWASWCLPCKAEMPELIALHQEYEKRGLAVLGVTVNDLPRDSRAFEEELEVPYPSVIGTPAMLEDYGLSPWLPITLLVQDRQIVREWVGPQTRATLEYPIRVALGLAPPIADVLQQEEGE
jgi:thiol-disulfide isomerase/thioredoxin